MYKILSSLIKNVIDKRIERRYANYNLLTPITYVVKSEVHYMSVSKVIQIEFTDCRIQAADAIYDIRKAAESASLNLYARHHVQLQYPMLIDNNKVVVELKIPEEIVDTFSVGNHLRGISTYLLKRCGGRYDKYLVGKRLLNYIEIPAPEVKTDKLPTVDRLEAIVSFAKLLERSDSEALDYINRILTILKEAGKS